MTAFEHALLAANAVWAAGLHRRHGWQLAAMAGCAAVLPDWDGIPLLVDARTFAAGHRVWGHNLLACLGLGLVVAGLDYRCDLVTRAARRLVRWVRQPGTLPLTCRTVFHAAEAGLWMLVAVAAMLSHLVGDMVVSGTAQLPDWELQLLWPFSDRGWVFPLVPWGDPGITLVFVGGMFAAVYWRSRLQPIGAVTLLLVTAYLAIHGVLR